MPCGYHAASRTVRIIIIDFALRPLPLWAKPVCAIQYRISRSTSTWFPMRGAVCVTVDGGVTPPGLCAVDEGYLTVRR